MYVLEDRARSKFMFGEGQAMHKCQAQIQNSYTRPAA